MMTSNIDVAMRHRSHRSLFLWTLIWIVELSRHCSVHAFGNVMPFANVRRKQRKLGRLNVPSLDWIDNIQRSSQETCRPKFLRSFRLDATSFVAVPEPVTIARNSFYLTRIVFLRALAFVYGVSFVVSLRQNKALLGDSGITPARNVLNRAQEQGQFKRERRLAWRRNQKATQPIDASTITPQGRGVLGILGNLKISRRAGEFIDSHPKLTKIREVIWDRSDAMDRPLPTLLWLAKDREHLNPWLDRLAITGIAISSFIGIMGSANVFLILALYMCHRSLWAVGGIWFGYGWEPQLAELGFHSLFLVPFFPLQSIPAVPVHPLVNWTIRWHLFRIMLGAGLIKFRAGDAKWKNLTAMYHFYETQPVPNPLTRYFHWAPKWIHKLETVGNHLVEVVAPWLIILPGLPVNVRRAGGVLQIVFQSVLISSGNLSFLNWLTAVPAIMCLDDAFLGPLFFSRWTRHKAAQMAASAKVTTVRNGITVAFFALIARLSVPVVRNLLSKRQIMNASFDRLRLVNSYGAFGVVSEEREEFIVSSAVDYDSDDWREYEFKAKPGDVYRSPPFLSPYHYRLDWQMWIAAVGKRFERSTWIREFLVKLLEQDPGVLELIRRDPWKDSPTKPKYIRVDLYKYRFHRPAPDEKRPPYWDRQFVRRLFPARGLASVDNLRD